MQLLDTDKSNVVSKIKDPFKSDKITKVGIEITPAYSFNQDKAADDGFVYEATVRFKNGDTSASQKFTGNGLQDLVTQIQKEIAML